jgi:hypothetical protein
MELVLAIGEEWQINRGLKLLVMMQPKCGEGICGAGSGGLGWVGLSGRIYLSATMIPMGSPAFFVQLHL